MSELTELISSTTLGEWDESNGAVVGCPREHLGLSCISDQYTCLCESTNGCKVETTTNAKGEPTVLTLNISLIPNIGEPRQVLAGIDLTGYKADFRAVSREAVRASFDLRKPENAALRLFVQETGV